MLNITVTPVSVSGPSYGPSFSLSYKTIVSVAAPTGSPSLENGRPLGIPWHDLPDDPSIFALLSWHTRTSDFGGREYEMTELRKWALSDNRVSVKFISGEGGVGKSRLAAEFAESLQKEGWAAGFVDLRNSQNYIGKSSGTLFVVDYPEEHRSAVKELLEDLVAIHDACRLRVLFLTRQSISGWNDLIQTTRAKLLIDMTPIRLDTLDAEAAHDVYLSISEKTAEALDRDWQPLSSETMDAWLNEAPENDRALFVMAAGTYNVLQSEDPAVKYKGRDIIESLVERELGRLQNSATDCGLLDQHLFTKLVAVATIAGVIPWEKIESVLHQIGFESGKTDPMMLQTPLQEAALLINGQIRSLKPDIVASVFLVHVLSPMGKQASELIWTGLKSDIEGGLQRLARLSYDAEFFLGKHHWRLRRYLADAVQDKINRAKVLRPYLSTSQLPFSLMNVAVATWGTLLQEADDGVSRALLFNNLSVHLSYLGKRMEALSAAERAVEIRERLAAANPDAYEPDLAITFGALGTVYLRFNEIDNAFQSFQNGISALKRLFLLNPPVFTNLMTALVRGYMTANKELNHAPDMALLSDILEVMERLKHDVE